MNKFSVGDIVRSSDIQYALRSGSSLYPYAIVVQESPLVLVSEGTDMRWEPTVQPDKLVVIGRASEAVLTACMKRL